MADRIETTDNRQALYSTKSVSFDRWLITWFAVLLAHMAVYLIGHDLLSVSESRRSVFLGFGLPVASSLVLMLGLAWYVRRKSLTISRWSDAMLAWHFGLAIVLFMLAEIGYWSAPLGELLGAFNALNDIELAQQARQTLMEPRCLRLALVILIYGLGLVVIIRANNWPKPALAGLQAGLMIGLLLLSNINLNNSGEIRLAQPNAPEVFFAWQAHSDGCIDYRFTAEGARSIWLGDEGLASVEPMNYGRYCDRVPRLLRIVTSDEQEKRYLIGLAASATDRDGWWRAMLVGILSPLFILALSAIAAKNTHIPSQRAATLVLVVVLNIVALEFLAYVYLGQRGEDEPFLLHRNASQSSADAAFDIPSSADALDVHLGYTYSEYVSGQTSRSVYQLPQIDYQFLGGGFLAYAPQKQSLERPIVVVLGGSTSDGLFRRATPWPEILARLLREHGLKGTVVNGGVAGYSSNQELLKLLRDVLPLQPDLVIAYHGINEIAWRTYKHPMVHPYQYQLFQNFVAPPQAVFLPNLVSLAYRLGARPMLSVSYGSDSGLSDGQQFLRNISLMHAISQSQGIEFLSIIQPVMGVGRYPILEPMRQERLRQYTGDEAQVQAYYTQIQALYAEILQAADQQSYVLNFTEVLTGHDDVYLLDGRHLTDHGNALIAKAMLQVLEEKLFGQR